MVDLQKSEQQPKGPHRSHISKCKSTIDMTNGMAMVLLVKLGERCDICKDICRLILMTHESLNCIIMLNKLEEYLVDE